MRLGDGDRMHVRVCLIFLCVQLVRPATHARNVTVAYASRHIHTLDFAIQLRFTHHTHDIASFVYLKKHGGDEYDSDILCDNICCLCTLRDRYIFTSALDLTVSLYDKTTCRPPTTVSSPAYSAEYTRGTFAGMSTQSTADTENVSALQNRTCTIRISLHDMPVHAVGIGFVSRESPGGVRLSFSSAFLSLPLQGGVVKTSQCPPDTHTNEFPLRARRHGGDVYMFLVLAAAIASFVLLFCLGCAGDRFCVHPMHIVQ